MAAKEICVYSPSRLGKTSALSTLVDRLGLSVDVLPEGFPLEFSAQRGKHLTYLLIESNADPSDRIAELLEWEKPSHEYKAILSRCRQCIVIHYRDRADAVACLVLLGEILGKVVNESIFENGFGCLLRLSDVLSHLDQNPEWSWERERFPEINGVAESEWIS